MYMRLVHSYRTEYTHQGHGGGSIGSRLFRRRSVNKKIRRQKSSVMALLSVWATIPRVLMCREYEFLMKSSWKMLGTSSIKVQLSRLFLGLHEKSLGKVSAIQFAGGGCWTTKPNIAQLPLPNLGLSRSPPGSSQSSLDHPLFYHSAL